MFLTTMTADVVATEVAVAPITASTRTKWMKWSSVVGAGAGQTESFTNR